MKHCCKRMKEHVEYKCDMHPDPWLCNRMTVGYIAKWDAYGIIMRDRGRVSTVDPICFCPWCGKNLPPSRYKEWGRRLKQLGIKAPYGLPKRKIPEEFRTDAWYRGKSARYKKGTAKRRRKPRKL